jgi:hypothetical protein
LFNEAMMGIPDTTYWTVEAREALIAKNPKSYEALLDLLYLYEFEGDEFQYNQFMYYSTKKS